MFLIPTGTDRESDRRDQRGRTAPTEGGEGVVHGKGSWEVRISGSASTPAGASEDYRRKAAGRDESRLPALPRFLRSSGSGRVECTLRLGETEPENPIQTDSGWGGRSTRTQAVGFVA